MGIASSKYTLHIHIITFICVWHYFRWFFKFGKYCEISRVRWSCICVHSVLIVQAFRLNFAFGTFPNVHTYSMYWVIFLVVILIPMPKYLYNVASFHRNRRIVVIYWIIIHCAQYCGAEHNKQRYRITWAQTIWTLISYGSPFLKYLDNVRCIIILSVSSQIWYMYFCNMAMRFNVQWTNVLLRASFWYKLW